MILTPQAQRLVAHAVRDLNDPAQWRWEAWTREVGNRQEHIPPDVAEIVLDALRLAQGRLEDRLANPEITEDDEADLLNDLAYVQAIKGTLLNEGLRVAAG